MAFPKVAQMTDRILHPEQGGCLAFCLQVHERRIPLPIRNAGLDNCPGGSSELE